MSRKTVSFGQLLEYLNTPEHSCPAILQNLRTKTDDLDAIEREFLDNARYLPPRKNGNVLYHEVLSFSDLDRGQITPALENLARKYLELRAPYALAYGKAHLDTDCPHIHLMISANNVSSSRRLRVSRSRFANIKRELEAYQREQYPFLKHSLVIDRTSRQTSEKKQATAVPLRRRRESERVRRLRKQGRKNQPSEKELLRTALLDELTTAHSGEAFFLRLKLLGLRLYRRGRTVSVEDMAAGRRYRLKTLGLDRAFSNALDRWQVLPERLQEFQDLELERSQRLWNEMGFREEIRDLLKLGSAELTDSQRQRLVRIQELLREQRNRQRKSQTREI